MEKYEYQKIRLTTGGRPSFFHHCFRVGISGHVFMVLYDSRKKMLHMTYFTKTKSRASKSFDTGGLIRQNLQISWNSKKVKKCTKNYERQGPQGKPRFLFVYPGLDLATNIESPFRNTSPNGWLGYRSYSVLIRFRFDYLGCLPNYLIRNRLLITRVRLIV